MVFSSIEFLCVFLPVVFLVYCVVPSIRAKNILLILASLLFYAYGEPIYVLLMLVSTIWNYSFGLLVRNGERKRKFLLAIAIIVNIAFLGVFKYADMVIGTVNQILSLNIPFTNIALPIGLSFFTFQAMSYVIDVYRGEVKAQKNYLNILLYISFFPQLVAGPIIKYHDIEKQIRNRNQEPSDIAVGLRRFILGLAKKVFIANTLGAAADALFTTPIADLNILSAWIAAIAYMLQIYYDFSGYSDMAIGLGRMFGFKFLENFRYPYSSTSMKEFWRRWHISLSTWFKEYLYIPLGGNRVSPLRTGLNKVITFFVTGLWHGASWTFVVWGLFHGAFLLLEQAVPRLGKLPKALGHIYTLIVVCVAFVLFRADSFAQGLGIIGKMFSGFNFSDFQMGIALEQLTPMFIFALIFGWIFAFPILPHFKEKLNNAEGRHNIVVSATYICSVLLLALCLLNLSGITYNPFIYFRF